MINKEFGYGCADWWGEGKKPLSILGIILQIIVFGLFLYTLMWKYI